MALDLLNVGDSRAVTKAKMDAAFAEVGLPASGDTTDATDTFNDLVTNYLINPLLGLTGGMAGGTARARINAAITALNDGEGGVLVSSDSQFDAIDWERPNQRIYFQRGTVFRGKRADLLGSNIRLGAYGVGHRPAFPQSTLVAGAWTNVTGDIWSTPGPSSSPSNVFIREAWTPEGVTKLIKTTGTQTAPGAGQWGYSSSTLYINSPVDPNTLDVEHVTATSEADIVFLVQGANCAVDDLGIFFSKWSGVTFIGSGASGSSSRRNAVIGPCQDGISGGSGVTVPSDIVVAENILWYAGVGPKDGGGGDGDGISFHMASGGLLRSENIILTGNDIRYCTKSGIGNQSGVGVLAVGNYIEDCYDHIAYFPAPYTGEEAVEQTFAYNIIRRGSGERMGANLGGTAQNSHPITVNLYNNVLYSEAADSAAAGIFVAGSGTNGQHLTIRGRNNIITGFARGIQDSSGIATLDLDHNDVFGNTTNYWDNSSGNLAPKAGANSITSDPLFTDAANGDFTLQSGSPCINAGEDVGLTEDYAGNPVPFGTAPDIGAYERQS